MAETKRDMDLYLYQQLSVRMKTLQQLFKELKLYHRSETLNQLGRELSSFSFISAFLDLEGLTLVSTLGKILFFQIASENRPVSKEYLKVTSRIFKTLVEILRAIKKQKNGDLIDSNSSRVPSFWEDPSVDISPILGALRKQLITREDHFRYRSLSLTKDEDFSHALKIPKHILQKRDTNKWLTLIYVDLEKQDDLQELLYCLEKAEDDSELLLHGRFNIPLNSHRRHEPGTPYYLLLESSVSPEDWLAAGSIIGRIIRRVASPESHSPSLENPIIPKQPVPITNLPVSNSGSPVPNSVNNEIKEVVKEVPVASKELLESLNALAERNRREEERDFYRKIQLKPSRTMKGRGMSIGMKLILIISLVIFSSLAGMTFISSFFFLEDVKTRIEEENLGTSSLLSRKTEQDLWGVFNRAQLLILGVSALDDSTEFIDFFFRKNPEFLYLGIPGGDLSFYNEDFLLDNNLSAEFINTVVLPDQQDIYSQVKLGTGVKDSRLFNLSPYFKSPVTGIAFPYRQGTENQVLVLLLNTHGLFGTGLSSTPSQTSFILSQQGDLIFHPDISLLQGNSSFKDHPVITDIQENQGNNKQIRYLTEKMESDTEISQFTRTLGAFKRIDFGKLVFITEVEESLVFESVYDIRTRNFYIMGAVMALSILIVYFFSKSISTPLSHLVVATKFIEQGNYNLPLKVRSRDETGILTRSFIEMGQGLAERERLKDSFGRFVNQEIAEMASKGELALGGETKQATVFFSDIRSFTAISEKLSPEEVVSFLNEYMTLMVECVEESGGVVDKYIGDAIMAVWGAPLSNGNDEERCINASLAMREKLREYNKGRGSDKKPIIRIGCGINSGAVLAGQIGSNTKMEYTVIGDTVNLASRIEGLNKPMGTDILISQDCKERVEGIYNLVPMNAIKVKGKIEPQHIFAVLGRKENPSCPPDLKSLRAYVGIEGDFSGIADVNKEEKKYEIIG